jgi:hypothetical protein
VNTPDTAAPSYPLTHEAGHYGTLAELLDPDTWPRLTALSRGGTWAGATCLEIGAGGGSIAHKLANAVGDNGQVLATDQEVDQIPSHPRLTCVQHDLRRAGTNDDPLLAGPFDLGLGRWVLEWLPQRETILDWLVARLAPGGTILIEAVAPPRHRPMGELVVAAPSPEAAALHWKYQQTVGRIFDAAGLDAGWALQVNAGLRARGLVDVDTKILGSYWSGGDAGCRMIAGTLQQMRPRLLEAGMTGYELDTELDALLHDDALVVHGHLTYSTSGRQPA